MTVNADKYIQKLANKNPNVELVGNYLGTKIQTQHRCKKHDVIWMSTPDNVLAGYSCPKCKQDNRSRSRRKSHEQYVEEVKSISPDITVTGKYVNSQIPITHLCNRHNYEWLARPYNILAGKGCPECRREKCRVTQALTTEQYKNKLEAIGSSAIPLQEYINSNTPIDHYHKDCGHITKMAPTSALSGAGCILCKGKKISEAFVKSQDAFEEEIALINPNIKISGKYINTMTNINCECKVCGYTWSARPGHLIEGHGCPNCAFKRTADLLRKPHNQFVEEMYHINPYVEISGTYISESRKIDCKCKICGHHWTPYARDLMTGRGCPNCKETIGERKIRTYLERNNIKYVKEKRFKDLLGVGGRPLSYDFFLPEYRLLIEFQGEQHERAIDLFGGEKVFEKQQEHDSRKKNYALSHGYLTLEIFYKDIKRIDDILDEFISTLKSETVTTTGVV